jgi:clan AA aspartic protease (TIGR02281 family)
MKNNISSLLGKQGYHKIPLKRNAAGHFKLNADINGKSGSFILDTSASHTVIDDSSAEKFGLKISKSVSKDAGGLGTAQLKTRKSRGNTIRIKDFSVNNKVIITVDLSHVNNALEKSRSEKIDGVLGADLLKKHRALIDYAEKTLYLK